MILFRGRAQVDYEYLVMAFLGPVVLLPELLVGDEDLVAVVLE